MWKDSIVEETRAARDAHAKQYNFDLDAIYQDLKRQEATAGRALVNFPPKHILADDKAIG